MPKVKSHGQAQVIRAVGYLRKSTKEDAHETSLADQKSRILKMRPKEEGMRYEIVRWYADPATPGWKRGHKRPDYFKLVNDIRDKRDVEALLVDDADRFSRADSMETVHDVQVLRELGIRYIHADNQGVKDLTKNPAMTAMQIALEANASHEHCTRLSRRIAATRAKKAAEGIRTGGRAPYAMESDGQGALRPGNHKQLKTLQWLFIQVGNHRSKNSLAAELNKRGVPGSDGGLWYGRTIEVLLRNRAYRGEFTYNKEPRSPFHRLDANGQVVEKSEANGTGKRYSKQGVYEPVIDPALFDKVQKRLDVLKRDVTRRKRIGYALTGVLVCGHCRAAGRRGSMCGMHSHGKSGNSSPIIYRCSAAGQGVGLCGHRQVRQDRILPFIVKMLGKELTDLKELLAQPPDSLSNPSKERNEHREQLEHDRDALAAKIEKAEENLLFCEDPRTRQSLDKKVSALRDQLDKLEAELTSEPGTTKGYSDDELQALADWWDKFDKTAISLPVSAEANLAHAGGLLNDPFSDESAIKVDPRAINEALLALGCEVTLWWQTRTEKSSKGNERTRHDLVRGRFRLGQQSGTVPKCYLSDSSEHRQFKNLALLSKIDRVFDGAALVG
jgi:DNA invertase Pin-like site-specific DNA recombinase